MNIVYISSPYSDDVECNAENARKYMKFAIDQGVCPIVPHLLYPQVLNENNPKERKIGLNLALNLIENLYPDNSELWVMGNRLTDGMTKEIDAAIGRGICIRFFTDIIKV